VSVLPGYGQLTCRVAHTDVQLAADIAARGSHCIQIDDDRAMDLSEIIGIQLLAKLGQRHADQPLGELGTVSRKDARVFVICRKYCTSATGIC
jgi:hypothetical protein